MLVTRTILMALLLLGVLGLPRCAKAQDGAHGHGHAELHPTYKDWKTGTGYGCCDDRDCRPTRAYVDEQGRWRAMADGSWVIVPPDAVLKMPSPDGRSHICMTPGAMEPRCFVPGEPRI